MHQENNTIANASTRWPTQPLPASQWTRDEDKLFERALLRVPEDALDRWEQVAGKVPGKSPIDVKEHFDRLIHDVSMIDSGRVALPNFEDHSMAAAAEAGGGAAWDSDNQISFGGKTKHGEPERKKGTPWTEHEHKLFLIGLDRFGKGDWRSISRNVVVSRTPTQVASHAQKYFLRQSSVKKERKRSSIHDITTVETKVVPAPPADPNWVPSPQTQSVPMQQLQQPQEMQPQFNIPPNNVLDQRGVGRFGYSHYGY